MARPFKMKGSPMQRNYGIGSPVRQDKVKTNAPDKKTFIESLGGLKDPDHVDLTVKPTAPRVGAPGGDPNYKPTLKTKKVEKVSDSQKPKGTEVKKVKKVYNVKNQKRVVEVIPKGGKKKKTPNQRLVNRGITVIKGHQKLVDKGIDLIKGHTKRLLKQLKK